VQTKNIKVGGEYVARQGTDRHGGTYFRVYIEATGEPREFVPAEGQRYEGFSAARTRKTQTVKATVLGVCTQTYGGFERDFKPQAEVVGFHGRRDGNTVWLKPQEVLDEFDAWVEDQRVAEERRGAYIREKNERTAERQRISDAANAAQLAADLKRGKTPWFEFSVYGDGSYRDETITPQQAVGLALSVQALKVIGLDPRIREYLENHDPKALEQVDDALSVVEDAA
jgi:hypothetical protein